ncbi:antitoxin of toxin-antitoxin (TA) system Phd [Candidatus Phycorickettsia trachydisci]|uniref:Antitoxin n=2 Tax=Candidatus Phycorickettsia trachydisci TaxID=2115978 RepID=A0A2P1P9L5_9RICK|nr:antitoxin of toxin-antitoxin (TA) system Phd [Candidatus Phycorickettsia trachydisci]
MHYMSTTIGISQFKAHCLEIIDQLQRDQNEIIITKRDKPVAKVISLKKLEEEISSIFGMLKEKAEIKSDLIEAINEEWSAENE